MREGGVGEHQAETQKETVNINKSLSALGNCISALAINKAHIPYRDSMLTRLLKSSLGARVCVSVHVCVCVCVCVCVFECLSIYLSI